MATDGATSGGSGAAAGAGGGKPVPQATSRPGVYVRPTEGFGFGGGDQLPGPWNATMDYVPKVSIVPTTLGPNFSPPVQPVGSPLLESCVTKGVLSTVMGGGLGMMMGVFMASFEATSPPVVAGPDGKVQTVKVPLRQAMKEMGSSMGTKAVAWGKNFAIVGGVYSTVECFIERERARHDLKNSMAAGCITGAALSYKSGWQSMCLGCAGFAAFSVVIDKVMDH